jgi:hypothetical protein
MVFVFLLYIVVYFLLCLLFISLTPHWVVYYFYSTFKYFSSIECVPVQYLHFMIVPLIFDFLAIVQDAILISIFVVV